MPDLKSLTLLDDHRLPKARHDFPPIVPNRRRTTVKSSTKKNTRITWRTFDYYPQLKKVHSYVSEHPDEAITLRKAANIAAMARNYFSVFFHRNTGVTFKYWRTL